METLIPLLVNWLPLIVILGVIIFSGMRLSRQYQENIELSRSAIETIRENTEALRELTRRLEER